MNNNHDIDKGHEASELLGKKFFGIVEDVDDPRREGRCRIRIYGLFDDLAKDELPWAFPRNKNTIFGKDGKGGAISIPKKNAVVLVEFNNGELYSPEFYDIQELADDVKDELTKGGEYEGSHFLLYDGDEELKVWFTKKKGITIHLKDSRINIAQDSSITIEHKDSQSIIELTGGTITINSDSQINMSAGSSIKTSSQQVWIDGKFTQIGHNSLKGPAVLGDKLFLLLTVMASVIDGKYPPTPGLAQNFVDTWKAIVLSDTVTVSK